MARPVDLTGALLLSLCACRGERVESPQEVGVDSAVPADGARTPASAQRRPGVPHSGQIDLIRLSADGSAAVTRDALGGVRLWPTVDGESGPVVIPVRGPIEISVERAHGGLVVAAVDGSGAVSIFRLNQAGAIEATGQTSPYQPALTASVLPRSGRVAVLGRDHTIAVHGPDAGVLAKHEARQFRPTQLRVAADGSRLAAVVVTSREPGKFSGELQVLEVSTDTAARIEPVGSPVLFDAAVEPGSGSVVMSPDATRFAVIERAPKSPSLPHPWVLAVSDADGTTARHEIPVTGSIPPAVGFVSDHEVLATTPSGNPRAWLLDLDTGNVHGRMAPPDSFANQLHVQAHAHRTQVTAHGTWLFVHDVSSRDHRFIGYDTFSPTTVAISPTSETVAWGYGQGHIEVEPIGDRAGEAASLRIDPGLGVTDLAFVDAEHLLVADGAGAVKLFHVPSASVVAEAGLAGTIRSMQYEATTGLLLVVRHSNDARVFEVDVTGGIAGAHVVADGSFRHALLASTGTTNSSALWTLDHTRKARTYALSDLREDIPRAEALDRGTELPSGMQTPAAVDRHGTRYVLGWKNGRLAIEVHGDEGVEEIEVSTGAASQIIPSYGGAGFLAIHGNGTEAAIAAYARGDGAVRWSYSTGLVNNRVVWSPDDRHVGIASNAGGVVLDSTTGRAIHKRCGFELHVRGAPPPTALAPSNVRPLCE